MHLNLLLLCVILSQSIIGTISSKNITEPSDLLVRKKRVLHLEDGNAGLVGARLYRFVVNILLRETPHCVGSIIAHHTVITSSLCATDSISSYKIVSGSVDIYRGSPRNVIEKKIRIGTHTRARAGDGIALFFVEVGYTTRRTDIVPLHTEPVVAGENATAIGWGCYFYMGVRGTTYPNKLRSITVPIMQHRACVETYQGFYDIIDEDVCIYDEHKRCGHTDSGAPLVINGELAGVYLKRPENHRNRPAPEVFVLLQHERYRGWIHENIVN